MAKLNDIAGKTFGNWEILYRSGSTKNKASVWRCKCNICGTEKDIAGYSLTQGKTTKCRKCSAKEAQRKKYTSDPIMSVWSGMKQRCYDEHSKNYKNYGGRGILICDEWLNDYESFCDWAYKNGYGKGMSIERVDVNGNYEPSNCKFIPLNLQSKNRRNSILITISNETKCLQEWCDYFSLKRWNVESKFKKCNSWNEALLSALSDAKRK